MSPTEHRSTQLVKANLVAKLQITGVHSNFGRSILQFYRSHLARVGSAHLVLPGLAPQVATRQKHRLSLGSG